MLSFLLVWNTQVSMYVYGMGPLLRNASITNNAHYWEESPITTLIIITADCKNINFNNSSLIMGSDASITIDITHWWTFHSFNLIINYCYAYGYFLHYIIHCHYWSTEKYHSHYSPITDDPNFIHFHFITHYWEDKVSITQFLSVFCPHFHYPFITAESKQLLDFQ